ncbi:MAG TPA: MFS transporter [Acidimicrobiales bacterium]|nr:MFS transporter [Acidimicrobiales bacterium]
MTTVGASPSRWLGLIPWTGPARRRGLTDRHIVLLALLSAAAFFDGYDVSIKSVALTQIREDFDLTKAAASALMAVVYFGALPAMALTRAADRVGRRRMLLVSIVGYTLFSGLTAVAPSAAAFAVLQFCQQVFLVAESALVWTMAAEELPAEARGFGFGVLGMNMALGTGAAALLYGGVFEPLGLSWRWLYVVGVPPLLLVAFLRRRLGESRRFREAQAGGRLVETWRRILRPPYARWLGLVVAAAFLLQLSQQAQTFALDFLQTDRGLSASAAAGMLVVAGLPGIPVMVAAGGLSDRFGRRAVGCGFTLVSLVGGAGFFWLPASWGIPVLLPCMSLTLIGSMASFPVIQTYTAELFPTALRGSASSWSSASAVLGRTMSLGLAAVLLTALSQSATATLLGAGPVLAVVIIALLFPDTHGRELEETSGEGALGPPPGAGQEPAAAEVATASAVLP